MALRKFALLGAIALVGFGIWYFAIRTPEPKDDFVRFQGEWQVVVPVGTRDGQLVARAKPVAVRVTGDRWVFVADGQEGKRYAMTLRPDANPKEIVFTMLAPDDKPKMLKHDGKAVPVVLRGVYSIERDRAKVVTAPGDQPRPTSTDAPDVTVWFLERVK